MENNQTKLNGKLIISLSRALQVIHKESEVMFRKNGLTMAQFMVLEALYHKGELTVNGLIEAVLSTSGNMTVVIRNLEQHGLVHRTENPADKRSFFIHLTESGRVLISTVFEQHMELVAKSLIGVTNEEKETVIKILRKLM